MKRPVLITTPIPSADEVAESLGISKSRMRTLHEIVDGRLREKRGDTQVGTLRRTYGDKFLTDWPGNVSLDTIRRKTGKSLIQLIREHKSRKNGSLVGQPNGKAGSHAEAAR
jgi:hypothetical protein